MSSLYVDANDRLRTSIPLFRAYVASLNLAVPPACTLASQLNVVEHYLTRRSAGRLLPPESEDLKSWYDAMTTVSRLTESVLALKQQPQGKMRKALRTILQSDLTQDFVPNPGKDLLYEFEIAAWLSRMQFNVTLGEPDVRASGNGLSRELGFACKYPSSDKQIQDKITEGYRQLRRHQLPGVVAIGLDQVAFAEFKLEALSADSAETATRDADAKLYRWVSQIAEARQGLVAEVPLDGAVFSLNVLVVLSEEHGLAFLRRLTLQTATAQHPLMADLSLLHTGTTKLQGRYQ